MNKVKTYIEQYKVVKVVLVAIVAILIGVFIVLGMYSCKLVFGMTTKNTDNCVI